MDKLCVFSGTSNPALARGIAEAIGIALGRATITAFPDGETFIKIDEDVRGKDVFIIQSTSPPPNEHLMELLIFIDCVRRASASRITAVIPYFGYARQDRKDEGRVPITAKLVANLLAEAGADRVLTLDLHAAQIQGFFDIPVDHLTGAPVLSRYYAQKGIQNLVIVSPDVGSIKTADAFAHLLGCPLATVDKRRNSPESVEVRSIIGDVKGRVAILTDDMISTAGTLSEAALAVRENGALEVFAAATHPVFCQPAYERLANARVAEVCVLDTIPVSSPPREPKVTVLTCAPLLGEALKRIHLNQSVSSMFMH